MPTHAHSQLQSHGQAASATFQSFANCYIREVDAGCRCSMLCREGERDCVEWYLARQRLYLRAIVATESVVGPKRFDALYCRPASEPVWRTIEPLWAVQCLMHDLFAASGDGATKPGAELELLLRILQSCQRIERSLSGSAIGQNAPDGFIESEQSLVFGHWMHPTPKSLQGMSDWQASVYAPESAGRFQLQFFAARKTLVASRAVGSDTLDQIIAGLAGDLPQRANLGADERLLPLHPLQAEALLLEPDIQALIACGDLRHLGPAGVSFTATSSVRTVFSDECRWMLKFSLPVKITNSLRLNRRHELHAGVAMAELIDTLNLDARYPLIGFLKDPAYVTLELPGQSESGFEVIFRENPYQGGAGEGIVSLAALTAPGHSGGQGRLARLIDGCLDAGTGGRQEVALAWFDRYVDCALGSLVSLYDQTGIALEAHQQNMLVDVRGGWPRRVIYRDSQGFYLSERHRAALVSALPELTDIPNLFFADAEIRRRLGYYLMVNQIFAVVHRMSMDGLAPEALLLERLRADLIRRLPGLSEVGTSFVRDLLDSHTITTKANLGVRIADIDELEHAEGEALYRDMPNPLHPGVAIIQRRPGNALAS